MHPMPRRRFLSLMFLVLLVSLLDSLSGRAQDAPSVQVSDQGEAVLRITTTDQGTLRFRESDWDLTVEGIRGHARVEPAVGPAYDADTVLSYFSVAAAASDGRATSLKQYLLTVLGIILVIGLAAIVLYAAFLATDR